jgi:hypothetical protein
MAKKTRGILDLVEWRGPVEECTGETHSWSHFNNSQIDPYWIKCTLTVPHFEHYDSNTGLRWTDSRSLDERLAYVPFEDPLNDKPRPEYVYPEAQDSKSGNTYLSNPLELLSYQDKARVLVYGFVRDNLEKTDTHVAFDEDDVYIVWFCKTLQNWKALISTNLPDGMYYEVTYDGDRKQTYIDAYKKFRNVCVPD